MQSVDIEVIATGIQGDSTLGWRESYVESLGHCQSVGNWIASYVSEYCQRGAATDEHIFVATIIVITHLMQGEKMATMSTLATPQTATTTWNIGPVHSVAEFKVEHMMISNREGQSATLAGALTPDEADHANSRVEAAIEATSINTRDAQRDIHLKSEDFFHAEKFPTLSFKSTRKTRTGTGELAVAGDLTIRGVTRNVVFTVEGPIPPGRDPWGNTRLGLSATTKINRKDFGLTWNATLGTGSILVGDEVTITLDVQFAKA
jgi:polyisoprenoid-binding protein YceI